jgi:hypothetical protein
MAHLGLKKLKSSSQRNVTVNPRAIDFIKNQYF